MGSYCFKSVTKLNKINDTATRRPRLNKLAVIFGECGETYVSKPSYLSFVSSFK